MLHIKYRQSYDQKCTDLEFRKRRTSYRGWTFVEIAIVTAILITVIAMVLPPIARSRNDAKIGEAKADINAFAIELNIFYQRWRKFPTSLNELGRGDLLDPWGKPYQYLNIFNGSKIGAARKDHFLVPLNSDYDLFSMGEDGASAPPLSAAKSQDDILRAADGGFVGLASNF